MASSKRPTYKVETRLATERTRRKSDLVIMWHSLCGVAISIVNDLWITLLRIWEFIQSCFSTNERLLLQTWLENYLPHVPEDFSQSWRDGRLLAILLNKLRPGCFPDANRLDPDYGLKNVYRVFDALDMYFGIKPSVSVEEIVTCIDGSDAKLFEILLQLKNLTDNNTEHQAQVQPESHENNEQCGQWQSGREICIAKGTGLAVGFVGKITNFIIFCAVMSELDVVVEIRGPNSICSERITKRSPKKKRTVSSWEYVRPLTRSASYNEEDDKLVTEQDDDFEKAFIPLKYEVFGNQINISYKPKEKGQHKVTILWHGRHVSDSPYFVIVEDPSDLNSIIHLKSALKTTNECGKNETFEKSRKISVRFQETSKKCTAQKKHSCKIISRRVLRYIVRIHGKDIPVNAENTESLATELLKMDYDFEKSPSFHRRNSWGFAGDAERKKSVIRQFCVDVNELDAQINLRRTRSLSLNPGNKKLMQRSESFESLAPNLNIVSEDACSEKAQENEEDYAYINSDAKVTNQAEEVKYNNFVDEQHHHMDIEENTLELSPELTKSKFVESLIENTSYKTDKLESDEVSSLSTEMVSVTSVDNFDRDLQSNNTQCSSVLKPNEPNVEKLNEFAFDYQCSNMNFHHKDNENSINKNLKHFKKSSNNKMVMKKPKRKNCANDNKNHICCFKKAKRKTVNFSAQASSKKVARNDNSVPLSHIGISRKSNRSERQILKTRGNIPLKVLDNIKVEDFEKSEEKVHAYGNDAQDFSIERFNISPSGQNSTNNVVDTLSESEQYVRNTEEKELTEVSDPYRNIIQEKPESICKKSKSVVQEAKVKKLNLNCNSNTKATISPNSKRGIEVEDRCRTEPLQTCNLKPVEQFFINHTCSTLPTDCKEAEAGTKDANSVKSKPLQTHTLKAIEQFNFKQFNPSFGNQSSISPIKAQIGHWENALSSSNQNASSQKICTSDTDQVNFKEKLAFWENAHKTEQKSLQENNRRMKLNKKSCKLTEGNSDSTRKDNSAGTTNSSASLPVVKERTETSNSINRVTNEAAKRQTDDKISAELQMTSPKSKTRSFSDPVMLETSVDEPDIPVNISCSESSKTVYSSSSTEDNSEYYDSENSEDSGGDYLLQSTEDEYIDDEISESASEYWGDLSIVKGWKVMRCGHEYSFLGEEFLQSYQLNKSYPEQCKIFGIAIYYGHVAVKNMFQVYTGDSGFGNLSVSMQGFRLHDVSLISVAYIRNDIYEVTYQAMTAGYYLISIRWMDKEIPGSPFVCKVTF